MASVFSEPLLLYFMPHQKVKLFLFPTVLPFCNNELVTLCAKAYLSTADVFYSSSLFCGSLGFIRSDSWLTDGVQNKNKPKFKLHLTGASMIAAELPPKRPRLLTTCAGAKCIFQCFLVLAPGGAVVWSSCYLVGVASSCRLYSGRTKNVQVTTTGWCSILDDKLQEESEGVISLLLHVSAQLRKGLKIKTEVKLNNTCCNLKCIT